MAATLALSGWRPGASLGGMYLAAFPYFLVGVLVSLAPYLLFSWWTEKAPRRRWPYLAALTVCEAALLSAQRHRPVALAELGA